MQENEKIRAELLQLVEDLSDDELNERVEENSWTIMQVLQHLHLLEKVVAKSISKSLLTDHVNPTSEKPIHLTTDRRKKIDAPPFVSPTEEYITLAEMKIMLEESRSQFIHALSGIPEELLENKSFPHPVFNDLSIKQWIPFIGLHEKRHMKQIEELKGKLSKV
ncbi:hypothetical protein HNQ94_000153 [Salirhabdus euzebyi]|uniref:DinB-like domain-containing protein n=1 Tax=Salirhabdus euzebyi TaxID=394506 RepID=A0A841Q1A5_9BACI|nr:DinB family protein [Salirhabdus euzebyi]MBB6451732.1 hypothetical protein [Salirhabdus euzebyi]